MDKEIGDPSQPVEQSLQVLPEIEERRGNEVLSDAIGSDQAIGLIDVPSVGVSLEVKSSESPKEEVSFSVNNERQASIIRS